MSLVFLPREEASRLFPFQLGELQIDRVEELGGMRVPLNLFLAGLPAKEDREASGIHPSTYDRTTDEAFSTVQSWIVRTGHHVILIDTCAGNHKQRPGVPQLHDLDTPWLSRLAERGLAPEQVDFVMCTHLHADHVGWNTRLENGRWVPTFPNARYLFSRVEYNHWEQEAATTAAFGQPGVFEDSVLPCVNAGLATFVDPGFVVDDCIELEAAPGHTVGNCIIRATSSGKTGLFTGDCIHTPLQIHFPDVNSRFCELPDVARATRRRILAEAAEYGHLMIPAHFPAPFLGRVTAQGESFRYHPGL